MCEIVIRKVDTLAVLADGGQSVPEKRPRAQAGLSILFPKVAMNLPRVYHSPKELVSLLLQVEQCI